MRTTNFRMKLYLVTICKFLWLSLHGQVTCRYITSAPAVHEDANFNILVVGGNYFNDTWFSELSDVEIVNPFWENSICQKPNSLPDSLDVPVIGNVADQTMICGGLKSQITEEYGFEQTIERICHKLQKNESLDLTQLPRSAPSREFIKTSCSTQYSIRYQSRPTNRAVAIT